MIFLPLRLQDIVTAAKGRSTPWTEHMPCLTQSAMTTEGLADPWQIFLALCANLAWRRAAVIDRRHMTEDREGVNTIGNLSTRFVSRRFLLGSLVQVSPRSAAHEPASSSTSPRARAQQRGGDSWALTGSDPARGAKYQSNLIAPRSCRRIASARELAGRLAAPLACKDLCAAAAIAAPESRPGYQPNPGVAGESKSGCWEGTRMGGIPPIPFGYSPVPVNWALRPCRSGTRSW